MSSHRMLLVTAGLWLSGCTQIFPFEGCAVDADCALGCEGQRAVCVDAVCTPRDEVTVAGRVPPGLVWYPDTVRRLVGRVVVPDGVLLRIEPGAVIVGEPGAALIVQPGGQLIAQGTAERPIVFTSARPVGERAPGDWAGVALLGRGVVAADGPTLEGLTVEDVQEDFTYGGGDEAHSCGVVRYVRIEFAGDIVAPDKELNGLTLAGCGSDTVVEHVQVHRGADDGIEVFGGAVSLRHAVVTHAQDDGLDWDLGWKGTAQFVAIARDGRVASSNPSGFEGDGLDDDRGEPPMYGLPDASDPQIWNATLINAAPAVDEPLVVGMRLRDRTRGRLGNLLLAEWDVGLVVGDDDSDDDDAADAEALAGAADEPPRTWLDGVMVVLRGPLSAEGSAIELDPGSTAGVAVAEASAVGVGIDEAGVIDWVPTAAAASAVEPPAGLRSAPYHGAFAADAAPWTAGWTCYPID